MTRHRSALLTAGLAVFLVFAFNPPVNALDVPPLRGRVNDYAQLLPADTARDLESRLAIFERETGHQVAVLTLSSLEGEDIEGFSIRVADQWKIGQKGFDNGVILVVVPKDRKLRLEVGYGLEGVLPDVIASRIIRAFIVPHFRAGEYSAGILNGVDAVLKIISGEPFPQSVPKERANQSGGMLPAFVLVALLASMLLTSGPFGWFSRRRRPGTWAAYGRHHHPFGWGGGLGGGFGGGFGGAGFGGGGGGFGGGGASGSW